MTDKKAKSLSSCRLGEVCDDVFIGLDLLKPPITLVRMVYTFQDNDNVLNVILRDKKSIENEEEDESE